MRFWQIDVRTILSRAPRIQDRSADSPVRAFVPSDSVRADKAVRAPVSALFESALLSSRSLLSSGRGGLRPGGKSGCIQFFPTMIALEEKTPQRSTRNPPPTENVVVVRGLTKVFKDFWGRP